MKAVNYIIDVASTGPWCFLRSTSPQYHCFIACYFEVTDNYFFLLSIVIYSVFIFLKVMVKRLALIGL